MFFPFSDPVRLRLLTVLPIAAALLALAYPVLARRGGRTSWRVYDLLLLLVVVLGFGAYTNSNWERRRYFNPYEFFHYYVGAKYARELGYTRLYDAAVLVDREQGIVHRSPEITDLGALAGRPGPEYKRLRDVYREEAAIRAPFTPERWRAFAGDVAFFRDQLDPQVWERELLDKGYNATPVWTSIGGLLAGAVPTSNAAGMRALAWIDVLLLALAFAAVGWAFGHRPMLFALAFYLTHYCTGHAHFRAAFLRTDWFTALVVAVCCLRRGFPAAAGALTAHAALSRVFPALFVSWAVFQLAWSWLRRPRPVPQPCAGRTARQGPAAPLVRYLTGFALAAAVLFGASLVHGGGLAPWKEFASKIAEHDERPASDTVGFRNVFLWTAAFDESQGQELRTRFEERRSWWWACQALFAATVAWVLREKPAHEALALGFALVYFAAAPAYYYYALLLVPLLYCAGALERPARAIGLALLFGTSVYARAIHPGREMTLEFSFRLSVAFGLVVLFLLASAALERRSEFAAALPELHHP